MYKYEELMNVFIVKKCINQKLTGLKNCSIKIE
jgi:hypothetical protein